MKKLACAFSAIILCLLLSCGASKQVTGGMSDKARKNLDNTIAIAKMFETGDFSKAGDYIAADAVDHAGPMGDVKGLDSMMAMFKQFSTMASDTKNEIVKEIADDEYSMIWLKQHWTAKVDEPMMGMKAGQRANMQSIEVARHGADGKITEHWSFISANDVMKWMMNPPAETKKTQ